MKKIVVVFLIAFMTIGIGTISAHGRHQRRYHDSVKPESVKIEGTLQLRNGQFAVASGDNFYYVPMIGRYVGFIDGLKEGSNVSFEGYARGNFLMPVKMTIGGKSYELAADRASREERNKDANNRNDKDRKDRGRNDRDRNDRDRKDRGRNDRGFNKGPGDCCGPYNGNGGKQPRGDFRRRR